jgi:hypothetical protein
MHLLTIPGRHESRALTDRCRGCDRPTEPVAVLDYRDGRQAAYGCICGHRWLSRWDRSPLGATS